jgi:hypothetical protein
MSEGIFGQVVEVSGDRELHAGLPPVCPKCGFPGGVIEGSVDCVKCRDSEGGIKRNSITYASVR